MRGRLVAGLGLILWVAAAATAFGAPDPQPPTPAPAADAKPDPEAAPAAETGVSQATQPVPPPTSLPTDACNKILYPPDTNLTGNQTLIVEVDSQTAWRPRGEAVEFNIRGTGVAADKIELVVCYRWKTVHGRSRPHANDWVPAPDLRLIEKPDSSGVTYASTVPASLSPAEDFMSRLKNKTLSETTTALGLIPLAEMRIMARQKDASTWSALDIARPVGISNRTLAFITALASVLIAWGILLLFANRRGVPGRNPFLRPITTGTGYASLSQLQIILWTFVVGASTIYVMVLAGNLVAISAGTLILLGISGAATVGAKIQDHNNQVAKAEADAAAANAGAANGGGAATAVTNPATAGTVTDTTTTNATPPATATGTTATTAAAAVAHPIPLWSDLVVAADNPREIDVTRVQMLFFTVIVALFVSMRVLSSGVIPEIPEGFLVLMGISNGVYLTSKFVPNNPR